MGARLQDLFGDASGIEPATPGSYGIPPAGFRLPASTRIREVTLQVSDLTRTRAFYTQTLGFRVLAESDTRLTLGALDSETPLIELIENRRAPAQHIARRLGLYHFAILLPTRAALGQFLRHLEHIGARAGASDHLVSEALYLQDPDNLGIEVYADRPRDSWKRRDRELTMATDPLDGPGLLKAAGDDVWNGMPAGTTIGHVHLHVGEIESANLFYSEAIGFDRMVWSYPGALFLAAGGYHHHLGTNVWAGPGAKPAMADDPQLLRWTVVVPTRADVASAADSVHRAGFSIDVTPDGASADTRDPWGTALRIESAEREQPGGEWRTGHAS